VIIAKLKMQKPESHTPTYFHYFGMIALIFIGYCGSILSTFAAIQDKKGPRWWWDVKLVKRDCSVFQLQTCRHKKNYK